MNRTTLTLAAILLIILVVVSLFLTFNVSIKKAPTSPFYVGVEFGYGNQFSQLKSLVDRVKNFTNLIVIGFYLTVDQNTLTESCNYIFNSGLSFIIQFTTFLDYNYSIFDWIFAAKQKYGGMFLGVYRFDEPGGNQLDNAKYQLVANASSYAQASADYVGGLSDIVDYYLAHGAPRLFTADYGLYWFDYRF